MRREKKYVSLARDRRHDVKSVCWGKKKSQRRPKKKKKTVYELRRKMSHTKGCYV